jgi:D-sedoheptulose 7-phosphate isomerase
VDDYGFCDEAKFFLTLHEAIIKTIVRHYEKTTTLEAGLRYVRRLAKTAHRKNHRVIFIGNGGSSAIASHMAVDWTKNGGIRAIAFNDAPTLTCLANDFGYDNVFSKQLEYYARTGDLVVIISSSGKSLNIMRAAEQAFEQGLDLVTFSGMRPSNALRRKGSLSFFVPASDYGIVELSHLALLHSIVSVS